MVYLTPIAYIKEIPSAYKITLRKPKEYNAIKLRPESYNFIVFNHSHEIEQFAELRILKIRNNREEFYNECMERAII